MTMDKKGPEIRDFDAVSPERRQARIGGRVVDVTSIPARVTLEMARFKDDIDAGNLSQKDLVERTFDIVGRITSVSDQEMTADWLLDNVDLNTSLDFINWILKPSLDKAEKMQAKSGNEGTAESPA